MITESGIDPTEILGAGVGLPGAIDSHTGVSVFMTNLPDHWVNVPVADMLKEKTGIPTFLLNDVNAITWGELRFGAARGCSSAVCFALGTGIGGGIVIDGNLVLGKTGVAGELGHLVDPSDGYMFAQINDGNCVALPFAKDFGWGAELKLEMIFQQLFGFGHGNGYPKERVVPEQRNKKILDGIKALTYRPLIDILKDLDPEFVKGTISGEHFAEYFYPACRDAAVADFLKSLA